MKSEMGPLEPASQMIIEKWTVLQMASRRGRKGMEV